jgi:hypothetical protein
MILKAMLSANQITAAVGASLRVGITKYADVCLC